MTNQDINNFPKVLIISHTVLSGSSNMGQFMSGTFCDWPSDKLCQLYFHSEVPVTRDCCSYYSVSDVDMLNSILKFKKVGKVYDATDVDESRRLSRTDTGNAAKAYFKYGRNRTPFVKWGRDLIWKLGKWNTKKLDEWIKRCAPDVIYFASGDAVFSYKITKFISKKYNLPVITTVYDDFYYSAPKGNIFEKLHFRYYAKNLRTMLTQSAKVFYLSPIMKELYDKEFGIRGEIQYKAGTFIKPKTEEPKKLMLSFVGGLSCSRWKSMLDIGRALKQIDPAGETLVTIYSVENDPKIIELMSHENGIDFKGEIPPTEVKNITEASDILIFAESCEPKVIEQIRCSLSTKVADYIASGRCIFVYGPDGVGSIEYFKETGSALVVTQSEDIYPALKQLIESSEERQKYIHAAAETAVKNHLPETCMAVLHEACSLAAKKKNE